MKNIFKNSLFISLLLSFSVIQAQDDLLDALDKEIGEEVDYTAYTFKSTHIINGSSVENMRSRQLDFRINHRFGQLNKGAYELFGLDNALINFSFDYGVTDRLMLGVRRGTFEKTFDGSIKYLVARQCKGKRTFPVTIAYFTDLSINTLKVTDPTRKDLFNNRLGYAHQILIARKFNEEFSLQLTPTFTHRNLVKDYEQNDIYAMGLGGRYKFIRRVALTWEYFYASHTSGSTNFYNPLAIGFDIETGGHVFQVFITNSQQMVEKGVIAESAGNIKKGGVYFGFNMSRVFALGKDKNKE